jgi:hypothetical protein
MQVIKKCQMTLLVLLLAQKCLWPLNTLNMAKKPTVSNFAGIMGKFRFAVGIMGKSRFAVGIMGKSRFCCRNCGNLFVGIMGTYFFCSELWENHVFLLF